MPNAHPPQWGSHCEAHVLCGYVGQNKPDLCGRLQRNKLAWSTGLQELFATAKDVRWLCSTEGFYLLLDYRKAWIFKVMEDWGMHCSCLKFKNWNLINAVYRRDRTSETLQTVKFIWVPEHFCYQRVYTVSDCFLPFRTQLRGSAAVSTQLSQIQRGKITHGILCQNFEATWLGSNLHHSPAPWRMGSSQKTYSQRMWSPPLAWTTPLGAQLFLG